MKNTHTDASIWALIQGQIFEPISFRPVPPPPVHFSGAFRSNISNGTAYGPMTYAKVRKFSHELCDYKTLCIVPYGGVQAVMLKGLAWRLACESFEQKYLLPGMTFFPWSEDCFNSDGISRILLIGYGEPFEEIHTKDITASCKPDIALPVGRVWAKPCRNIRGENLRESLEWTPPDMTTLEDLAPLVAYLAGLSLTEQNQVDFKAAEIVNIAENMREVREIMSYEKNMPKTDVRATQTTRKMLP